MIFSGITPLLPARESPRKTLAKNGPGFRPQSTKVPEVTLAFWIIKVAATTLGETGGDSVTMTLDWGYLAGTLIFLPALVLQRRL